MLQIYYKTKPSGKVYVPDVDLVFDELTVKDVRFIVDTICTWNKSTLMTDMSLLKDSDPVKAVQIRTPFGIADLTQVCTSVKCLALAMIYKRRHRAFVFNAALIGNNYLDILMRIAYDTKKIGVLSPIGEFYDTAFRAKYPVLRDGQEVSLWV